MKIIELDDREIATVLAALRALQNVQQHERLADEIAEIATDGGTLEILEDGEVDALCERINVGEPAAKLASDPVGTKIVMVMASLLSEIRTDLSEHGGVVSNLTETLEQIDDILGPLQDAMEAAGEEAPATPKPRVKYICEECGSDDVRWDAWAVWNEVEQRQEIETSFNAAHCGTCDGECRTREILVGSDEDPDFREVEEDAP